MKAKITHHEIKEIDTENWKNIVLYMTYEYKWESNTVSIIDIPEYPNAKVVKQYIKTAEKAINTELKQKEENENKLKKELKAKQKELTEMRKFVQSRGHDPESIKKALEEFKQNKLSLIWKVNAQI